MRPGVGGAALNDEINHVDVVQRERVDAFTARSAVGGRFAPHDPPRETSRSAARSSRDDWPRRALRATLSSREW
jgi:hypothetical protein